MIDNATRETTPPSGVRLRHPRSTWRAADAGFSLIEVLVSLTIFVVIVGIVFVFLGNARKHLETESGGLETQQAARISTDEIARTIQQAGYGISRVDTVNAAAWQRDMIYAGPYAVAFNADIDGSIGPLSAATTLTFPDGSTYTGEGTAGNPTGAETYWYTIDADGNGTYTSADHTAVVSGGFNPASETACPLDYAVFKRTYGFNGTNYGGTLVPVTGFLFTNATTSEVYGDGTQPDPLFTYWLTEDLKGDNILADTECVVPPCPPSPARAPKLYLWGDTNFDGVLSEAEKTALRTLPVGSPNWAGNALASGGVYYSTTLSNAYTAATGGGTLKVASGAHFGTGEHVRIGTGSTAEDFVISSADTSVTPNQIQLVSSPQNDHASSETVTILPQTLRRAIRTVQINFDAITPKKDYDSASAGAAAGRAGHAGTRGLEYRVRPFERRVELINLRTGALSGASTATPNCPSTFTGSCSGSAITALDIFVPRSTTVPVSFILKDFDGTPLTGKTVTLSNSNTSVGTLSSSSTTTDGSGLATIQYTPTGANGVDVITASHSCINSSLASTTMTAAVTLNVYRLEVTLTGNDCMRTFKTGFSAPSSAFTVKVKNPAGTYLNQYPLTLTLAFDPTLLPGTPDYTKVTGQLSVGGSPVGNTSSTTGIVGPYSTDTQPAGTLNGSFALAADTLGNGTRLLMTAAVSDSACVRYGTSVTLGVRFYKLSLVSVDPNGTCTESAPCTIPTNTYPYPSVKASLTINSTSTAGTPVTFTSDDFLKPAGTAASVMSPSSAWTTDGNGDATVSIYNNNDAAITAGTPLKTHIDATSTGPAAFCANGSIGSTMALRPEFDFTGPTASGCDVDLQQSWIKQVTGQNKELCIDVKNASNTGGCSVVITGLQTAIYKAPPNNATLESWLTKEIHGGSEQTSTGTCNATNSVQEFIKDCYRFCNGGTNVGKICTANSDCPPSSSCPGGADMPNNTRWDFINYTTKCYVPPSPPSPIDPQKYFVFDDIVYSSQVGGLATKRQFVVTVYFTCGGICSAGSVQSKTFTLQTP